MKQLQGEDSERPLSFSYRREIIDEFKTLLVEATASLDAECHESESVSLGFYFPEPFIIFEFGAVVVCCIRDLQQLFCSHFVTWVRGANIRNYDVLV